MTSADTKAHFTQLGWEPVVSTPQELGDYIRSEVVRWGKVLQAAGAVGIE
jgi:tripartite-type tricarboxylate transporter receptor subunit TctC